MATSGKKATKRVSVRKAGTRTASKGTTFGLQANTTRTILIIVFLGLSILFLIRAVQVYY